MNLKQQVLRATPTAAWILLILFVMYFTKLVMPSRSGGSTTETTKEVLFLKLQLIENQQREIDFLSEQLIGRRKELSLLKEITREIADDRKTTTSTTDKP